MARRQISVQTVQEVVNTGEIIENYPNRTPYPSRLILGWVKARPLHISVADNHVAQETVVITAYQPDSNLWQPDFKIRKP